jgi:hypothetical protein
MSEPIHRKPLNKWERTFYGQLYRWTEEPINADAIDEWIAEDGDYDRRASLEETLIQALVDSERLHTD